LHILLLQKLLAHFTKYLHQNFKNYQMYRLDTVTNTKYLMICHKTSIVFNTDTVNKTSLKIYIDTTKIL